jgi:predicted phosphodiesterase
MMIFENVLLLTIITAVTLALTIVTHVSIPINENDSVNAYANNHISLADINFAAVGDWGCTSNTKNVVNNMILKDPELVLGLGDYAYNNSAECWLLLVDPIDHKMKIAIGNHDANAYIESPTGSEKYVEQPSPTILQEYLEHFNLSRQYYSFDYQNVHFIAMSTEVPFGLKSKQYNFVSRDLEEARSKPNIKWIVVFHHKLVYTSPSSVGHKSLKGLTETYHPLFEKYAVDLVIQGHSHTYQRSYPIKYNAEDFSNPLITDKNTSNYNDPKGQIFTIAGTGGATEIHNFTGTPAKYMAVQFQAFGFLNLDVLHNGTKLVGEFHDNEGTIRDRFTIIKR